jgi:hypothetical protein
MRCSRALRTTGVGAATLALMVGPLPLAVAEGPGYGGTAAQLAVTWEAPAAAATVPAPAATTPAQAPSTAPSTAPVAPAAPEAPIAPEAPLLPADQPQAISFGGGVHGVMAAVVLPTTRDPQLHPDGMDLVVRGLGFRGKSKIQVRIGSDQPVVTRADSAGALAVALDPGQLTGAKPGVSVMAVGRNQSGTEVTLFGSIPPVASGSGPMTIVPWAVASIAIAGLALWTRRRHAHHLHEDAVTATD